MNLHEYQAKALLTKYGIPVPDGEVITNVEEAVVGLAKLGTPGCVMKAQVHAGGRGKAGGIRVVNNKSELTAVVKELIGSRLVTYQTDEKGQPINQILIEAQYHIKNELYLGAVVDRAKQCIVFMVSTEGGVDIEKVAEDTPDKILKIEVDQLVGVQPYQCRELAFGLNLENQQIKQFTHIMMSLSKMFIDCDLSLLEINPLIISDKDDLICLDAKINIDDNALFRQANLRQMRDANQEDARENHARQWELNYIALDGNIGCMVNGAGLAMATMDLIKLSGGSPANFLDVGGSATKDRVTEAFKIILSDANVKAVLVNIFGGIVRCDLIADGIIGAIAEVNTDLPVVVRLEGNNADIGSKKLADCGLNIISLNDFEEAALAVVKVAKKQPGEK